MKWIGLIFLILCGAMAGMACSGKLRMKLERTEKLCSFLREMGVLMQYQMSTLGELLDTFSNRSVYQEFQFLSQTAAHMQQQTPFVQAWSEQVQAEKHLPSEVKEVLLELGEELGTTDLEGQLSALSQAHIQLQRFQDTYRVTYQKKGKLYHSLGLLAGLLLAVLFC